MCVCIHISSWDAAAVSKELVQADAQLAAVVHGAKYFLSKWLEHPHEHVSLAGTDQPWVGQILQGGDRLSF